MIERIVSLNVTFSIKNIRLKFTFIVIYFQQCLNLFSDTDTLEYCTRRSKTTENKEKIEVNQLTHRFIDSARQVEAFFLQKRFLLSALKPELIVKEDVTDLKVEIVRKEELIRKHYEKILVWQNLLAEMHCWVQPNGEQNHFLINGRIFSTLYLLLHCIIYLLCRITGAITTR